MDGGERSIFEEAPDAIFLSDEAGRILDANAAACALTGYSRDEIRSLCVADLHPREHAASVAHGLRALQAGGTVLRQRWLRRRDGILVGVELHGRRLSDGRTLGIARDLTARKRAEAELLESQRLVRRLADSIPGVVYVFDLEQGRFVHMNDGVHRVLGLPPEHFLGLEATQVLDDVHPDDRALFVGHLAKLLEAPDGAVLQQEHRMRHAGGGWRWVSVRDTVFTRDADRRPRQILGVADDVTERRQLQEDLIQAQKLESVGRLAGGVAHDFNNYLTVILGLTDLLVAREPECERRGELEAIGKAARQAAGLTAQLLAFARKQAVEPRSICLNDVVGEAAVLLGKLLGERIVLETCCDPELRAVSIDPGQMMQVLMNLGVNARDAMPEGGRLRIETSNVRPEGGRGRAESDAFVRLLVGDTGVGMSDAVKARLFEPFFTTKERGKGTGLGLATVYGAIAQAGGHITVESELGRGASFEILLPCGPTGCEVPREAAALPVAQETGASVLVVEDERVVRETAVSILRASGFQAIAAASGAEALGLLENGPSVDLLLTDVLMPGMSGPDLARRARVRRPELRVLFVSGHPDVDLGASDPDSVRTSFLQKPFAPDVLVAKLAEMLSRASA